MAQKFSRISGIYAGHFLQKSPESFGTNSNSLESHPDKHTRLRTLER